MSMRSVNRFQKKVRQQYNQNLINMGVTIPAGIYLGEVTQNSDPDYPDMRVKVHVFRLLPAITPQNSKEVTDDEPELGSIWCQRMSPFAANTDDYSYGMMGPPPEPGNTVIVAYTGDYASGIILGVLPDLKKNQGLFTGGQPAAETSEGINPASEPDSQGNQTAIPVVEGTAPDLLKDDPMRRPSQRFNPRNTSISAAGGNHVTVSPGDREDGTGAGVRMGTGRGAQLLMDNRSDTIYMNNASGNGYISMDTNGNIDMYCEGTFSVHAVGGFNFHTDNSFVMQADDGINMKSLGGSGVKIQAAGGNLDLSILNDVYITAQGGEIHALAGSNIIMKGSNIHLNGPDATRATPPTVSSQMGNTGVTQSVSGRVPEAEPWRGHTTYSRDADQSGNRSEYSTAPGAGIDPSRVGNEYPPIPENSSNLVFWQNGVDRRISQQLFDALENIAREYGKALKITKGYVIPSRSGGTSNADNSLHMTGQAVDIIHAEGRPEILRDEVLQIIELAKNNGIGGIGVYNDRRPDAAFANELHFDLGRERIWGECADGTLQYECLPTAIQNEASELGYDPEIPIEDARFATGNGAVNVEDISGNSNAEKLYNYFVEERGYSPQQAAGAVGSLMGESYERLDPTAVNSIGATGIAQWLGPRKNNLYEFSANPNAFDPNSFDSTSPLDPLSFDTQLQFLDWELNNDSYESRTDSHMVQATNAAQAAEIWTRIYERPSAAEISSSLPTRQQYANNVLSSFY